MVTPDSHPIGGDTVTCSAAQGGAPEFTLDPYDRALNEPEVWDVYDRLRSAGPVAHSETRGGFYLLGGFDEVRTALRNPAMFSSAHGHRIPTDGTQKSIPIDVDPPLHTEYRKVMTQAVSPARVRAMRPFLTALIGGLVEDFRRRGGGDFVRGVALPLPLQVLTELVGFSPDTVMRFRELTETMWGRIAHVDFSEARGEIYALMKAELDDHRSTGPREDFVSQLLKATVHERLLTEDEQIRILSTFAVAGHETTMNASSTLLWLLTSQPDVQARLRENPSAAPRYVEEMLRYRTPAQNFARRTTCPVAIGDVEIPEGQGVLLSFAAANRDPDRFPEPDRFDPDRDSRGHLAFGWGIHQCMGASLARLELAVLLETLCNHPPVRLDGDVTWSGLQGGNHLGPTRLPLRFDERTDLP